MSDQVLEFKIKTTAELAGMQQYIVGLKESIAQAKAAGLNTGELEKVLKSANKEYSSSAINTHIAGLKAQRAELVAAGKDVVALDKQLHALDGAKPLGLFGKIKEAGSDIAGELPIIGAVKKVLNGNTLTATAITGGIVGGLGLLKEGLSKAQEEFQKAEVSVARLDGALANNGKLTGEYRSHLQELAETMSRATNIADDDWLAVLTRLTQFGADSSNIDGYAATVKNLAGIMGGDIQGAAELFSKAMQGSTEMLGRYGIHVDQSLTLTQKLAEIQRQAAARGAGQLEAATNTLSGSMKAFGIATDEALKGVGNLLNGGGGRSALIDALTEVLRMVSEVFPKTIEAATGLENKFNDVGTASSEAADQAARIGAATSQSGIAVDALNAKYERTIKLIGLRQQLEDKIIDAEAAVKMSYLEAGIGPYGGLSESQKMQGRLDIKRESDQRKETSATKADSAEISAIQTRMTERSRVIDDNMSTEQEMIDKNAQLEKEKDPFKKKAGMATANIISFESKKNELKEKDANDIVVAHETGDTGIAVVHAQNLKDIEKVTAEIKQQEEIFKAEQAKVDALKSQQAVNLAKQEEATKFIGDHVKTYQADSRTDSDRIEEIQTLGAGRRQVAGVAKGQEIPQEVAIGVERKKEVYEDEVAATAREMAVQASRAGVAARKVEGSKSSTPEQKKAAEAVEKAAHEVEKSGSSESAHALDAALKTFYQSLSGTNKTTIDAFRNIHVTLEQLVANQKQHEQKLAGLKSINGQH